MINKVCSHRIDSRIMPRWEDFFPKEQPPGSVLFFGSLLFCILLTLWYCVHYVISATSKTWYLKKILQRLNTYLDVFVKTYWKCKSWNELKMTSKNGMKLASTFWKRWFAKCNVLNVKYLIELQSRITQDGVFCKNS